MTEKTIENPLDDEPSPVGQVEGRGLWARLKEGGPAPSEPEALDLACYAEGRADPAVAERVEAFLARTPAALDWIEAARTAPTARPFAWARVINQGRQLVAPSRAEPSRGAVRWGALAASLLLVGMLGFELGRGLDGNLTDAPARSSASAEFAADLSADAAIDGPIDSSDPIFVASAADGG